MKQMGMKSALTVLVFFVPVFSTFAGTNEEENSIRKTIGLYEQALNSADVENIVKIFSDDGVLVLQGSPTRIGTEAVKEFFISIFKLIDFDTQFHIEEIVHMSPEWAFVRTTTRSINSADPGEGGHEIFILKKQAEENWKIARYAGSSAK